MDELNKNYDRFLPIAFAYGDRINAADVPTVTAAIKKFYFENEDFSSKDVGKLVEVRILV